MLKWSSTDCGSKEEKQQTHKQQNKMRQGTRTLTHLLLQTSSKIQKQQAKYQPQDEFCCGDQRRLQAVWCLDARHITQSFAGSRAGGVKFCRIEGWCGLVVLTFLSCVGFKLDSREDVFSPSSNKANASLINQQQNFASYKTDILAIGRGPSKQNITKQHNTTT